MPTDHISAVNALLEAGDFTRFSDIFRIAPAGKVARASGVHILSLKKALNGDLAILTLDELFRIAGYFRVSEALIVEVVLNEIAGRKKKIHSFEASKKK